MKQIKNNNNENANIPLRDVNKADSISPKIVIKTKKK